MKVVKADLLNDIVSSYDQNKTTIYGRAQTKVINSNTVLGPPINSFVDVVADSAAVVTPNLSYLTTNGRLFNINTIGTAGFANISCHEFNLSTGVKTYVGNIRMQFANAAVTTATLRSIKVIDTGTTGWKIFVTTLGSVLINGGVFLANNVDKADFIPVGFTNIPFATGNNQKATYFLQDPANIGAGQLNIAAVGSILDVPNNRLYVHNGVSATHQYYVYNTNISPTYNVDAITGTEATNLINHAGHAYVNNTPLVFTSLTGGAGLVVGTVYFVVSAVPGVSYQLSATSGGAAINFTTDISAGNIGRAYGTTGSNFVHKTGNLPALVSTLLVVDSEDYAVPSHTANSGQPCAFLATNTNLYMGRLSDLTPGAVTWPSLITVNALGTVNQIVTPTITLAAWSTVLDRAIYLTNANILVVKQMVNNSIENVIGGANNKFRQTFSSNVIELGFITATSMDIEDGWLVLTGGTAGQVGNILCDLRSDVLYDYSYVITKVLNTPSSIYKFLTTTDELFDFTGGLSIEYRTSGFGTDTGGWTSIPFSQDLTAVATGAQVQFKIKWATLGLDTCIPAQLRELFLGYETLAEISDNWEFSDDYSDNNTPSRVAFRLKNLYASTVPTLYFRAYDLTDALLINNNSVTNAANFEYSTNNGLSWLPLGTIPNTVGTLVRYTFTSPPGVDIRPGLKES